MKILVIGSGGREHALCRQFKLSKHVAQIYCADGNAGIADVAECVAIKPHEIEKLADFAAENSINLTFVGGETALALGIADEFERRNLKIIGVSRRAARLEASKSFAKDFMRRHSIPTAEYRIAHSTAEARNILRSGVFGDENSPVVVKADGLAAGKGVVVAPNRNAAAKAIDDLQALAGADAASQIVLEECLFGREVSLILFADGRNFALMPPSRDHKRIGEDDTGVNTGGMGTITDEKLLSAAQTEKIIAEIIEPSLKGCRDEGFPFRGIMFLGLMITESGAKLIEYNVRFGDPETQVILIRLKTDLVEICEALIAGKLDELEIKWSAENSACVVLAAKHYPQKPQIGDVINGIAEAEKTSGVQILHAGTSFDDDKNLITSGGRVLGVTATGENLETALKNAYEAVSKISFDGMQFRRDIGK